MATIATPKTSPVVALLRSCHPGPTATVTFLSLVLGLAAGLEPLTLALVVVGVLAGQLSIGFSNDWIDADRDRRVGRTDKPLAQGLVGQAVAVAAAPRRRGRGPPVVRSRARRPVAHVVLVAVGWAYNAGLKRTALLASCRSSSPSGLLPVVAIASPRTRAARRPRGPSPTARSSASPSTSRTCCPTSSDDAAHGRPRPAAPPRTRARRARRVRGARRLGAALSARARRRRPGRAGRRRARGRRASRRRARHRRRGAPCSSRGGRGARRCSSSCIASSLVLVAQLALRGTRARRLTRSSACPPAVPAWRRGRVRRSAWRRRGEQPARRPQRRPSATDRAGGRPGRCGRPSAMLISACRPARPRGDVALASGREGRGVGRRRPPARRRARIGASSAPRRASRGSCPARRSG